MIFNPLALEGAFLISLEKKSDERGFFARTYCINEFKNHNLEINFLQDNISFSLKTKTQRGLHYQYPSAEAKLVQCIQGEIHDVIVDIREHSPTFGKWISVQLTSDELNMLYIPRGFAHGYQTLTNNTLISYKVSSPYTPADEKGIFWNDPTLAIDWPEKENVIISEKDKVLPFFNNKGISI